MRAGFSSADITPPVGSPLSGWNDLKISERVADPLHVRSVVLETGAETVGIISADVLWVSEMLTAEIRRDIEVRHGVKPDCVMVAATHSHAGPVLKDCGTERVDAEYASHFVQQAVTAFGRAMENLTKAEIGFASTAEFRISHNRRTVMRDGTVRTQVKFTDPDALFVEGPIDPEVAVMAARTPGGELLGATVNFSAHPTHFGWDRILSAGYPGALEKHMAERGCPATLFLQGAAGNTLFSTPEDGDDAASVNYMGKILAEDAFKAIERMRFTPNLNLSGARKTVKLPYRKPTKADIRGTSRGAQRFGTAAAYENGMPALLKRMRRSRFLPAEVQVIRVGEYAFAGIPAEYFVENGLLIKEGAWPRRAMVVELANGSVGYVPHRDAFKRGGYETTFADFSCLAPRAGEILARAAVGLIRRGL